MFERFLSLLDETGEVDEAALRNLFLPELREFSFAEELFQETVEQFDGEELLEICSEIVLTIQAECDADDFHNWNYDHLEFIIDCSNRYGFTIPRNLLNGLPEQLIILVDKNKLADPECE